MKRWIALSVLSFSTAPLLGQEEVVGQEPAEEVKEHSGYLRVLEDEEGLSLEVASRRFRYMRGDDPVELVLVGVMHIGREEYYDALQVHLDESDLVLFEQVGPTAPGAHLELARERDAVAATHRRLQVIAGAAMKYKKDLGKTPKSIEALAKSSKEEWIRARIQSALKDAWSHPVRIEVQDGKLRAISLGADGEAGGTGINADLEVLASEAPAFEAKGIQKTLADALGLEFQLLGIDYTGTHYRRCDVTMEELQSLLEEHEADGSAILGALQGGSALEALASGLLKFMGASKSGRGMLKLVSIEALGRADELMAKPPAGMEALFEVLLLRRNDVVLRDVKNVLAQEPDKKSIAVFYGAGHMLDLETRLVEELELEELDTHWFTGVRLDFADTGMSKKRIESMRGLIRRAMERQLGK